MHWRRFLLLFLGPAAIFADAPVAATAGDFTLTPQMAERIQRVTGLGDDFPVVSARRVTAAQANTRQLALYLKDETGIEVTLRPGRLKPNSSGYEDQYERRFTVYLSADGGQFLAIKSNLPGRVPSINPQLPGDSAEVKARSGYELYQTFPSDIPKVSFVDAIRLSTLGNPLDAEEIEGLYIMDSAGLYAPHPVWVIMLRGVPWDFHHKGRLDMRNDIDAMTGKARGVGTLFILRSPP